MSGFSAFCGKNKSRLIKACSYNVNLYLKGKIFCAVIVQCLKVNFSHCRVVGELGAFSLRTDFLLSLAEFCSAFYHRILAITAIVNYIVTEKLFGIKHFKALLAVRITFYILSYKLNTCKLFSAVVKYF